MGQERFSRWEWVILCVLILLAGGLRLAQIDQAEFQWDQGEISKWALRMGQEGQITWFGPPSSTGLYTFPGVIWLLAIPYALSTSPIFATGFVAVINVAAVVGCYFLTRRWFGRVAAAVATLLYAVAPWAVLYSRKVWHTTVLPPFVILYAVTGWLAFVRGRRWAIVVHILALAVLIQMHLSTLPFILLSGLWALIFWNRLDWRLVPVGGLLAALTFVPYVLTDAQGGWWNVQHFLEYMEQPSQTTGMAFYATWVITTGLNLQFVTGPDRFADFVATAPNVRWLFVLEGALVVAAAILAVWRAIRQARRGLDDETSAALMTATWLIMPAVFLTRNVVPPAYHYFTTTLPAQFILIAWLVVQATRWRGRLARAGRKQLVGLNADLGLIVLIVAIAGAQLYETIAILRFVRTHDTVWGYGTPLKYEVDAVQTAEALGQEIEAQEVIVLAAGDEPRRFEMPVVADVLMFGKPHRSVDIQTALVFPAAPATYWATYDMIYGETLLAEFTPEITEARIPLREGLRSFRFYRWAGGEPEIAGLIPLPGGARRWASGAELIGYTLEGDARAGETIRWTVVWRATRTPTEDVYYHWFNHLLDADGRLLAQADGPSLLPAYWRSGDVVLNWFELTVPVETPTTGLALRLGMYTYPGLENVPVVDSDGSSQAEWIIIDLPVGEE